MKLFIDSADIGEIKEAIESGIVDGVTTNPSLIKAAKEKNDTADMKKYIKEILKTAIGLPVSLEVAENRYDGMKSEALKLNRMFKKYKNLVVKIPVNPSDNFQKPESFDGLKIIRELAGFGIKVNATLVMTPEQALLAAKAGASYVSPFAGRIDDYIRENKANLQSGKDFEKSSYYPLDGTQDKKGDVYEDNGVVSGVDLVEQIVEIFKTHKMNCQVLAASARNPRQVREFALVGSHITTVPLAVLEAMTVHHKTVQGVVGFTHDTVLEYAELLKDKRKIAINVKPE